MSRYARLPEDLILDVSISPHAVRVWARMERYQGTGTACYASRATIADDLGMSEAAVKRALRELISAGWISRVRRGRSGWEAVVNTELSRPTGEPCHGPQVSHARPTGEPSSSDPRPTGEPCHGPQVSRGGVTGEPCKEGTPTKEPQLRSQVPTAAPSPKAELVLVDVAPIVEARPITAQTLIGKWLDHCANRPPGNVVGQVAKQLGGLLAEGIDPDAVEAGLAAWHSRGLHPSTLPSVVNEILNPPRPGAGRPRRMSPGDSALALLAEFPLEGA